MVSRLINLKHPEPIDYITTDTQDFKVGDIVYTLGNADRYYYYTVIPNNNSGVKGANGVFIDFYYDNNYSIESAIKKSQELLDISVVDNLKEYYGIKNN